MPDWNSVNWEDLIPRLLLYTAGRLDWLIWLRPQADLPDGCTENALIETAIKKTLSGERNWAPQDHSLFEHLASLIDETIETLHGEPDPVETVPLKEINKHLKQINLNADALLAHVQQFTRNTRPTGIAKTAGEAPTVPVHSFAKITDIFGEKRLRQPLIKYAATAVISVALLGGAVLFATNYFVSESPQLTATTAEEPSTSNRPSQPETAPRQTAGAGDLVQVQGTIERNFYTSANNAGAPRDGLLDLVSYLRTIIDFRRDIENGDRFEIVYEKSPDTPGISGDIVSATLHLQKLNESYHITRQSNAIDNPTFQLEKRPLLD